MRGWPPRRPTQISHVVLSAKHPRSPGRPLRAYPYERGFTLIEILVALAILAVALAAGMRSVAQSSDAATTLKQRTLALWVAQNRLAEAQLANPWPAMGAREGDAEQARARFVWHETVSGTPNPAFRKIEIAVADPSQPEYMLVRLVGYLAQSSPR